MSRTPIVCGIDIGSTNLKVVGLAEDSTVVGRAQRSTPRDATDLSIDAATLLARIEDMIVEVCGDRYVVRAACAAGVGEDGVPVDADMRPAAQALAWFDPRRGRVYERLRLDPLPAEDSCVRDDAARTIVGWAWARQQGQLAQARSWVSLTDFAASSWVGRPVMSDTIAARTAAWNAATRSWEEERVRQSLGAVELLPSVVSAGTVVGPLMSERLLAASVVADDAVAVAGGHDHPFGGWAIDQLDRGAILDSMGTAEVVVAQSATPVARTATVDVAPGIGTNGTSLLAVEEFTRNVEWASLDPEVARSLRAIARGEQPPDEWIQSDAFSPGDRGGGRPRYAAHAPSAPGSRASAVLGALARLGASALDDVADLLPTVSHVYVAGGWSRAEGWLQLKESISGRRMSVVHEPEVAAVGAAMLAAGTLGWSVVPRTALDAGPRN